jgi:hypothetical protein
LIYVNLPPAPTKAAEPVPQPELPVVDSKSSLPISVSNEPVRTPTPKEIPPIEVLAAPDLPKGDSTVDLSVKSASFAKSPEQLAFTGGVSLGILYAALFVIAMGLSLLRSSKRRGR